MYLVYYIYYKLFKQKLIILFVKELKMFIVSSFFLGGGGELKRKKIDLKLQSLGFYVNFNFFYLLMVDLSYQVVQKVLNVDLEEQIKVFQDYSQNFLFRIRYFKIYIDGQMF